MAKLFTGTPQLCEVCLQSCKDWSILKSKQVLHIMQISYKSNWVQQNGS